MVSTPGDHSNGDAPVHAPSDRDPARILALLHDDEVRARIAAGHLRRLSDAYLAAVRELLALEPVAPSGHVSGFFLEAYRQGQADAFASVRAKLSAVLITGTADQGVDR